MDKDLDLYQPPASIPLVGDTPQVEEGVKEDKEVVGVDAGTNEAVRRITFSRTIIEVENEDSVDHVITYLLVRADNVIPPEETHYTEEDISALMKAGVLVTILGDGE